MGKTKGKKRALQAILIAGEEQRDAVLSGEKKITIRTGHRDYTPGPVMLGCHILNWATLKEITSVRHTHLAYIKPDEWHDDGFESFGEMVEGLKEFYPDIDYNSPMTVVRWSDF